MGISANNEFKISNNLKLSCGHSNKRTHLTNKLVLRFGKVKIRLFQPQIPLATLFIVSLFRQSGALCSLRSEAYGIRHSRASDSSTVALQHFLFCDAITFISLYTIAFLISQTANTIISAPRHPPGDGSVETN